MNPHSCLRLRPHPFPSPDFQLQGMITGFSFPWNLLPSGLQVHSSNTNTSPVSIRPAPLPALLCIQECYSPRLVTPSWLLPLLGPCCRFSRETKNFQHKHLQNNCSFSGYFRHTSENYEFRVVLAGARLCLSVSLFKYLSWYKVRRSCQNRLEDDARKSWSASWLIA